MLGDELRCIQHEHYVCTLNVKQSLESLDYGSLRRAGSFFSFVGALLVVRIAHNSQHALLPRFYCRVQDVALFKEGFPASDAIQLMAEDGDNSALLVSSCLVTVSARSYL